MILETKRSVAAPALLILSFFGLITCSSSGGLNPDLDPITEGDWYRPDVDTSWQWQLNGSINTEYDVDLYDIDLFETSENTIEELQDSGKKVICYFSAGSYEPGRPDSEDFSDDVLGEVLEGFEEERWLDIRSSEVVEIMLGRLDLAVEKGCDGVEPDNVDGYVNETGFALTATDQLAFNRKIANEAHLRNLTVGLKNDGDQVEELIEYYDFSLNEQCHEFDECEQLQAFIDSDKPVFNAEYNVDASICPTARSENIRTLILPLELDDSSLVNCDEE